MQRERWVGSRVGWTKPDVKPGALRCGASGWRVGLFLLLGLCACGRGHAEHGQPGRLRNLADQRPPNCPNCPDNSAPNRPIDQQTYENREGQSLECPSIVTAKVSESNQPATPRGLRSARRTKSPRRFTRMFVALPG